MNFKVLLTSLFFGVSLSLAAQEYQQLSPSLKALTPSNIFPVDADKNFSFSDKSSESKPATFVVTTDKKSPVYLAEVFSNAKSHFAIQARWKSNEAIKKGDVLLARLSMRTVYAKQESGESSINFYVDSKTGGRSVSIFLGAGPEWKNFDIPFVINADTPAGEAEINITFGALAQKVEIANIEVLNFGNKIKIEQLPITRFSYAGREANAAWREDALKRIEEIRTAPLNIQVVDENGSPLTGAKVKVQLLQSDFIWGTAAKEDLLGDNLPNSAQYKKVLKEFFNTAVIENGFKSPRWNSSAQAQTKRAFEWLEKQGFRQRGHNLVWMGWKFNDPEFKELALKDTAAFSISIIKDIKEKIAYTKGRVIAWDVINEYNHEQDFLKYLPKDIAVKYYKLAKELDPKAQLFMNEYAMLNSIESPRNIKTYLDTIASMRSKGAPIDGIGIQGHVGRQPRNPTQVISDLDMFEKTGLPVQITEFDVNTPDEELQADYTRDFLIACYSHPVITGFVKWGFWQNAHWKPDAAMFRADWTPKPSAAVWREWVLSKWKTSFTKTTSQAGKIESRGHLGKYEITITKGNKTKKMMYQLSKNAEPLVAKL